MSWHRKGTAFLLGLLIAATVLLSAVTLTSDVDKSPTTGSSFTYTSFAVSGTNPAIAVLIGLASDTATVSSVAVSAGLSAGTPVEVGTARSASGTTKTYLSIWCIPAPSGTGTITVSLSASVAWQSNAQLWAGAHQTTPCPTGAGNVDSASGITPNPLTITLSNLTTDEAGIGIGCQNTDGDAPTFGPTETFNNNTTNINCAAGYRTGAGAVTTTWSSASSSDTLLAIRMVPAAGATVTPRGQLLGILP